MEKITMPLKEGCIFNFIKTGNDTCLDCDTIEGKGFMYHVDKNRNTVEFYVDVPSSKSFNIFGGLYDPTTGLVYATLYNNRRSIIAYDAVEVLSKQSRKGLNKETVTKAFINYKLSGSVEGLDRDLLMNKDTFSIIYRHIFKSGLAEKSYRDINRILPVDKYKDILLTLCSFSAGLYWCSDLRKLKEYSLIETLNNKVSSLPKLFLKNQYNRFNDISLFKSSTSVYIKTGDILPFSDVIGLFPSILKASVDDLYNSKETLVYSKDTVATLRRNGFANNVTKENIHLLKKCDDTLSGYTLANNKYQEKLDSYDYISVDVMINDSIKEIIYLNKTFRKISK